jgi:phage terminase large subunit
LSSNHHIKGARLYQLNPALKRFWRTRSRYKALYGGRASSKSHDAAGFAVYLAANYTLKFLCARQFQNRISESVYTLIKDKIENSEFRGEFVLTKNSIIHKVTGSEFLFYGIARNLSEIKSTEGVDILWLEEAHYLTEEQWTVIEPTIRKEGSQIWLIWNPDEITDFIYQKFVVDPPDDCISRKINWEENPYLSETMLKVIREAYLKEPELAKNTYGGYPKTGSDKSVINLMYIEAAMDAHIKLGWEPSGSKRTGFDVADDGADANAIADMYGNVLMYIEEWKGLEDELLKSATRVFNHCREFGSTCTYDSIGVGAHVGAKFSELNDAVIKDGSTYQLSYDPFNAGGSVHKPDDVFMKLPHTEITNKDYFCNIKAQMWQEVSTRFRKTYEAVILGVEHPHDELISINTATITEKQRHQLCMELSSPRKDTDQNGKFKVESKKDMREKRKVKSPNVADAVIMSAIKPIRASAGFFDF